MDLGMDREEISLTRTETNCLQHFANGHNDQEIGQILNLSVKEVESVLSTVMLKLRVPNRMAGAAKAARLGLVTIETL